MYRFKGKQISRKKIGFYIHWNRKLNVFDITSSGGIQLQNAFKLNKSMKNNAVYYHATYLKWLHIPDVSLQPRDITQIVVTSHIPL